MPPPDVVAAITLIENWITSQAGNVLQVYAAAVLVVEWITGNLPSPASAHRLSAVRCDKNGFLASLADLKTGNVGAINWTTLLAQVLAFLASLGVPLP